MSGRRSQIIDDPVVESVVNRTCSRCRLRVPIASGWLLRDCSYGACGKPFKGLKRGCKIYNREKDCKRLLRFYSPE